MHYISTSYTIDSFDRTRINLEHPLTVKNSINGHSLNAYFGSSPSPFCAKGRSDDLSILIHAITQANKYIYVAVADYAPMNVFGKQRKPWPVLDDLLRQAVLERKVMVKLMLSERAYTYKHRKEHLVSLLDLNKETEQRLIEIKIFHVSIIPSKKNLYHLFVFFARLQMCLILKALTTNFSSRIRWAT